MDISGLEEKHLSQVDSEINNLKDRQHSKVELQSLPNRGYLDNTVVPILITGISIVLAHPAYHYYRLCRSKLYH